jgi:SAM-dependent methyltransferase
MIKDGGGQRLTGRILDCGCGIGAYLTRLAAEAEQAHGLEFDRQRARQAKQQLPHIIQAATEALPFASETFDLILSHEVLEHVEDDRLAVSEMVRALKTNGRLIIFAPNRGYPFETHGIYWRGRYHFGNIPLINYLPNPIRDRLAPHVRAYTTSELAALFKGLPVRVVTQTVIFGAYDNLIARFGPLGRALRSVLQALEHTPLRSFGLSHFWVVQKQEVDQRA